MNNLPETAVPLAQGKMGRAVQNPVLRDQINVVGSIGNVKIFPGGVNSVCSSRDGNIWMGSHEVVFKVSMNGKVLTRIDGRKGWYCHYIACFSSGDAVVSYGNTRYIDRFTTAGKRIDFVDIFPSQACDIAVNEENQVVVDVNRDSLVLFSEQGQKLKEIKLGVEPFYTFCLLQDGCYRFPDYDSTRLVTVDRNEKITRGHEIINTDIYHITCDRHGNVIASSKSINSIYVISKGGEVLRTYHISGKIGSLAVDNNDRLLIVTDRQTITVAEYIE